MGEEVEELVKRLRERRQMIFSEVGPLGLTKRGEADTHLLAEAADTIESLRASLTRVEEERDALQRQFEPRDLDVERCAVRLRQIVYGKDQTINCRDLALAAWRMFFDGEWDHDAINNRVRFTPKRLSRAERPE